MPHTRSSGVPAPMRPLMAEVSKISIKTPSLPLAIARFPQRGRACCMMATVSASSIVLGPTTSILLVLVLGLPQLTQDPTTAIRTHQRPEIARPDLRSRVRTLIGHLQAGAIRGRRYSCCGWPRCPCVYGASRRHQLGIKGQVAVACASERAAWRTLHYETSERIQAYSCSLRFAGTAKYFRSGSEGT